MTEGKPEDIKGTGGVIPLFDDYRSEPPRSIPQYAHVTIGGMPGGKWDDVGGATLADFQAHFAEHLPAHKSHAIEIDWRGSERGSLGRTRFNIPAVDGSEAPEGGVIPGDNMAHMRAIVATVLVQNTKMMELVVQAAEKQTEAVTKATAKQAEVQTTAVTELFKHVQTLDARDRTRHDEAMEREQTRQLKVYEMMAAGAESDATAAAALAAAAGKKDGMGAVMEGMVEKMMMSQLEAFVEGGGDASGPVMALLDKAGPLLKRFLDGVTDGSDEPKKLT